MKTPRFLAALAITLLVGACATPPKVQLPAPLSPESTGLQAPPVEQVLVQGDTASKPGSLRQTPTPSAPVSGASVSGEQVSSSLPPLRGEPINANVEGIPVPAFINEFFGTILGVGFQMDPLVAKMNDLVTLRTSGPQSPQDFYRLAVQVLRTYGVATRYEEGRVRFVPIKAGNDFQPPLVLSGRALPSVPITHRPVFQLVELRAVRLGDVIQWLRTAFKTDELQVVEDLNRNAIVLYGKPDIVHQAAEAIEVLDRPYMRGRVSTRLEPAFVGADELAKRLVDVLVAEGYGASLHTGAGVVQAAAVIVLPIASGNTVLLFAADPGVLNHAVEWARTIDKPNPTAGSEGLFYYRVQNTKADDIVRTLNGMRPGPDPSRQPVRDAASSLPAPASAPAAAAQVAGSSNLAGGQLILDAPRNGLIFQGSGSEWGRLLPLIRQMDQAPRQVMIEVTIAEVTLDNNEQFGVSWFANSDHGRFNGTMTSGVIGGGASDDGSAFGGLTYLLDIAGEARAQLRAFAEDNRVSVLSTPRLLVKSGEEASIDVGTEVPTISSQTASNQTTEGTSNLLQSVQYRKTGIILDIKPVVYSDNRIDLEIRQEVSEALPIGSDSTVQSPAIFNRSVSTNLSLHDGSSVIIGGLMSRRSTDGDGGVPYLKDIPLLGSLFKSKSVRHNKTELILMIVPYIIETDAQASSLSQSIGQSYQLLDIPANGDVATPLPPVE